MTSDKSKPEYWNAFFRKQIKKESDRAAVIISVSMIDQALEALIRAVLVQHSTADDPLFDGSYAPLANFSAKIDMAYRIGLLPSNYAKGLHIIRKMRNELAHNINAGTFEDPTVRSRMHEINKMLRFDEIAKTLKLSPGLRGEFEATVLWIIWQLWSKAEIATPFEGLPEFYPAAFGRKEKST